MLRFHLDEHVAGAIAIGLGRHGVDVSTSVSADLVSAEDESQLEFAQSEDRVLVTHDDDFLRLHAAGTEHAGIAWCRQNKYSIGELLSLLLLMNACYTSPDMANRVEYL
jgi:predicted nuclease of predicted toxin-antitoxin system